MTYRAPSVTPYDNAAPDYEPETPTLDEVIAEAMRHHTLGVRVALPAQVTAVHGNQQVDMQVMLQARYTTQDEPITLPIVKNAPVVMPTGQNYLVRLPVAVGDNGLAVFADRSLDAWSASDGQSPIDPQDGRQHDLSDALFFPGLVPFAQQIEDSTDDLIVKNGDAQVRWLKGGKFVIGSAASGGKELMTLLDATLQAQMDLVSTLQSAQVMTMLGPMPFLASTLASLQQNLSTFQRLKADLDTLKGA